MFFIGVFGIQDKDKHIGTYNNIICPTCGNWPGTRSIRHTGICTYFHTYVQVEYKVYSQSFRCGSIYELDPFVGREFEKDPGLESGRKPAAS